VIGDQYVLGDEQRVAIYQLRDAIIPKTEPTSEQMAMSQPGNPPVILRSQKARAFPF